ncbi:MAG: hypothetical protein AAGH88_09565 [Planctomycetota bacterium]
MKTSPSLMAIFFIWLCSIALSPAASAEDDYQLTFERPAAVGQVYTFGSHGYVNLQMIQNLNNQPVAEETQLIEAQMRGTIRITQVDEKGEATALVLTPTDYAGRVDGEVVRINLNRALTIEAVEGELVVKDADGRPVLPEVVQVLDVLLSFVLETDTKEKTDDQIYKLGELRRPGQAWECDHELIAEGLSESGQFTIEPGQIESEMRFVEVGQVFGEDAANLELDIEVSGFAVPGLVEQGFEMKQSTGLVQIRGMLPINPESTSGNVSKLIDFAVTAMLNLPDGQGVAELQLVMQRQTQAEYELQD